jgi:predicted amidophosphoribosyltransferase
MLVRLRGPVCARCGAPTEWPVACCRECSGRRLGFRSARAAVVYTGVAPSFVRAWKERGLRPLAAVAADLVVEVLASPAANVITYIPPDGDRSVKRGHHPAQRLARELAARWELDLQRLLARTRTVARQAELGGVERRANVRGAFRARGRVPTSVVLVDDVYTTGATVGAAATALRAAGAREVEVVTFARAVR